MPLSPELLQKAKEWRLAAAFLDIDNPVSAATALLNLGKGPLGVMEERELTLGEVAAELTEIMERVVAEMPPEGLKIRRDQLRNWLTNSSYVEIESWKVSGVLPWEQPIWTNELEKLAAKRGLALPWKQ